MVVKFYCFADVLVWKAVQRVLFLVFPYDDGVGL